MRWPTRLAAVTVTAAAALTGGYVGVVTGALAFDLGVGRRHIGLGPQRIEMAAPREVVFDIIAGAYTGRRPRAVAEKIRILESGTDMVLAAHRTHIRGRLVATTVETVRFIRPERVEFRLVRGPVPHVVETFTLTSTGTGTALEYRGELGTDLWWIGQRWGAVVADRWERTVAETLANVATEAERRSTHSRRQT